MTTARRLTACTMAFIVLAVVTAWTPMAYVPTILSVLAYGVLCAGLGIWVQRTVREHWKR